MNKRDHEPSGFHCIIIFALGETNSFRVEGAITTSNDEKIIVALVDHLLDVCKLLHVGSRKELHAGWNVIKVENVADSVLTLVD